MFAGGSIVGEGASRLPAGAELLTARCPKLSAQGFAWLRCAHATVCAAAVRQQSQRVGWALLLLRLCFWFYANGLSKVVCCLLLLAEGRV